MDHYHYGTRTENSRRSRGPEALSINVGWDDYVMTCLLSREVDPDAQLELGETSSPGTQLNNYAVPYCSSDSCIEDYRGLYAIS